VTDADLITLLRDWQALDELARAQASTLEKTTKAREAKFSELMFAARKRPEVLR